MNLFDDETLEASCVVANCTMNRDRELSGSNGYARELGVEPFSMLRELLPEQRTIRWLDLCCGSGNALIEAADQIQIEGLPVEITGVDLAGMFRSHDYPHLRLSKASLSTWRAHGTYDLITCVHGLHYVGDKLGLIKRAGTWLRPAGRFIANLDVANIKVRGFATSRSVVTRLREHGFEYSSRHRRLRCRHAIHFDHPFEYLGADPTAGPNYTGQPAVDSHYQKHPPTQHAISNR